MGVSVEIGREVTDSNNIYVLCIQPSKNKKIMTTKSAAFIYLLFYKNKFKQVSVKVYGKNKIKF